MDRKFRWIGVVMGAWLWMGAMSWAGEQPVVTWETPGKLSFTEVADAAIYRVEWASSLDGPWHPFSIHAHHGLDRLIATGTGTVTADVPMFYRVVAETRERDPAPIPMLLMTNTSFRMGNQGDPAEGNPMELPAHDVELDWYWIGVTPVTDAQWRPVWFWALENGYEFDNYYGAGKGPNHPATWMNWYDTVKWCNAASEWAGLQPCYTVTGGDVYRQGQRDDVTCHWDRNGYRLPTEAEWECAARAGSTGRYPWGDRISHSNANYHVYCEDGLISDDFDDGPDCGFHPDFQEGQFYVSPVDAFDPNAYGLYDVIGNASEWVWDWGSTTYYAESPGTNPRGPETGTLRIVRGGNYLMHARAIRLSHRLAYPPTIYSFAGSFRVVRAYLPAP